MTAGEADRDERTRARIAEAIRDAHERVAGTTGFPTYEVPEFVRERFPEFDPADPSTWPEPDRCTDGRPWGFSAYDFGVFGRVDHEDRWRRYLAASAQQARGGRSRDAGCRNRWKHEDSRLCGTHDKPWRENIEAARRRLARNARELENLDLARQLAAYGIEADGFSDSVRLQADAVRGLLRLLTEYNVSPIEEPAPFPTTDLTIPPPL